MHLLYIPMNRKETYLGLGWLVLMLLSVVLIPMRSNSVWEAVFQGVHFAVSLLLFHRFLRSSFQVPLTPFGQILKFSLLGLMLTQLANLLTNDLLFYFFPNYFGYSETGPFFVNVSKESIRAFAAESFPVSALCIVIFAPVWEELLHRGLIFGTLVQKSIPLAYLVSTLLYAFVPIIPLLGAYGTDYVILSFLQYIPIGILFSWIYTRTETILTPILAHIIMNAVSIFTMR